jgi:hypothetical protein
MNAFPIAIPANCDGFEDGMSLRDYFAGQALVGLLAGRQPGTAYPPEHLGETSYTISDAMMAERD